MWDSYYIPSAVLCQDMDPRHARQDTLLPWAAYETSCEPDGVVIFKPAGDFCCYCRHVWLTLYEDYDEKRLMEACVPSASQLRSYKLYAYASDSPPIEGTLLWRSMAQLPSK